MKPKNKSWSVKQLRCSQWPALTYKGIKIYKRISNNQKKKYKCHQSLSPSYSIPQDGQIEDDLALRQAIFFGGVEPQLRANVWPFLLHYYDFRTTFLERQAIMEDKHQLYHKIKWVTLVPLKGWTSQSL